MADTNLRILLVEDEPLLQYTFEQQLKRLGFRLHKTIDNGKDAVESVLAETFDLVFMDVKMPGLDGLHATQRIRLKEISMGKYTSIIGLTAFAHRGKCLRYGMDDFLQKPIMLEELSEIMNEWEKPEKRANRSTGTPGSAKTPGGEETPEKVILQPDDFDKISERLSSVKDKIAKLRQMRNMQRDGDETDSKH